MKVPDKHLSTFGRSQSNFSVGWRSQQLYVCTSFVKINSQVKRRQVLVDIPTVGKAKVGACISLQHLDGRHRAPGFSLSMELFVYFPIPSQGKALRSKRWSWGWFPICSKDGSAGSAELRAQSTGGLFPGFSGSLLCPLWQRPVREVCACLPSGCWQTRPFFF